MYFKVFYYFTIIMAMCCQLSIQQWVDPMDMNVKKPDKWIDPMDMSPSDEYAKYSTNPSSLLQSLKNKDSDGKTCMKETEIYFKRTINMILNSVQEDKTKHDEFTGHLYFEIGIDDYEYLKSFADGMTNDNDLTKVDDILERILVKPTNQKIQEFLESWFHRFLSLILSRKGIIFIVSFVYCYIIYKLIKENFKISYIIKIILLNLLIIDFLFIWIRLSHKINIEIAAKKIKYEDVPLSCNPQKMNYAEYAIHAFSITDTCKEYHELYFLDTFWAVSPGDVFAEMFSRIEKLILPIGSGFTSVCLGIINELPWPINLIAFIPMVVLFCIFIVLVISMIMGRHITVSLFHLISVSSTTPTPAPVHQIEHSRKYIEEIPDHYIENTPNYSEQQSVPTVKEAVVRQRNISADTEKCNNLTSDRERSVPPDQSRPTNFEPSVSVVTESRSTNSKPIPAEHDEGIKKLTEGIKKQIDNKEHVGGGDCI